MVAYIVRRLMLAVPTVLAVLVLVFSVIRLLPGDVVRLMVAEQGYAADTKALKKELGLDRPAPIQFTVWTWNAIRGKFGKSLWTRRPISEELKLRFPVSAELGLLAVLIGLIIAIPIGMIAAIRQDTWLDYLFRSFAIGMVSIPGFWLGTLLLVFPLIWWGWAPPLTYVPFTENPWKNLTYMFWPALLLGAGLSGIIMRLTRNQMLEVLRQDYIRTAWSKGLSEKMVVLRHAVKNALIPVVTVIGLQIASVVSGTVIFESIFSVPGIGSFYFKAIQQRDYPALQATCLFIAVSVILINLLVDLTYAVLDPRIRYT